MKNGHVQFGKGKCTFMIPSNVPSHLCGGILFLPQAFYTIEDKALHNKYSYMFMK